MEVTRYAPGHEARAMSLTLSASVVALAVAGIIFAAPAVVTRIITNGPLITYSVPIPPEPRPLPKPEHAPRHHEAAPRPRPDQSAQIATRIEPGPIFVAGDPIASEPLPGGAANGTGGAAIADPPPVPPVFAEPSVDPRYARDFQPPYPAEERRLGNAGLVQVRVLIGTDGRVKAIELVSSPGPAFFEVTRRQALGRWRFRPATRDGVPIERWRVMRVNFVLTDE